MRAAPASLDARYLFESAGNKSKALNTALAQIGEGLVVFLDDDIRVGPDLLEVYAEAARSSEYAASDGRGTRTSSAGQWKPIRERPSRLAD